MPIRSPDPQCSLRQMAKIPLDAIRLPGARGKGGEPLAFPLRCASDRFGSKPAVQKTDFGIANISSQRPDSSCLARLADGRHRYAAPEDFVVQVLPRASRLSGPAPNAMM